MKLKPYPDYKESGISWIGSLPSHWRLQSIKSILNERIEKNDPIKTSDILSLTIDKGVIPYSERGGGGNKSKEDITSYKLAYPNDIVLNSMNVVVGAVGLSRYFGAVSPVYYMLYPRNKDDQVEYFNNIFQSQTFQRSLLGLGNGILMKESESSNKLNTIRMRIPMDKLNTQLLPYPEKSEQLKIINFLKCEISKLENLISNQEKLIELLQEKRQAIISHAVTKGLDPNVKMKDSGVEWLGMVPEDWKILQFRHMVSIQNGSDYKDIESEDGPYPVIGSGGQFKKATNYIYDGASVLLGRKGTIDKPLYVEGKFWVVDTMFYTIIKEIVLPKYVFNCAKIIPFDLLSTSTALPSMTQNDLKTLCFAMPKTLSEQKSIIDFIENQTAKIDLLIEKAKQSIDLAKEHRTALISAAVTGKIDVREYA